MGKPNLAPSVSSDVTSTSVIFTVGSLTSAQAGYDDSSLTYSFFWNEGSGSTFSILITQKGLVYKKALNPGGTYQFKVQASNDFGTGPLSDPITVSSGLPPDRPNSVSISQVTGQPHYSFSWSEPVDNDSRILSYVFKIN
jgi:hypothetical protein